MKTGNMYYYEEFKNNILNEAIQTEAKNIKKYASREEIDRLNYSTYCRINNGIYEQLTGNDLKRIAELVNLCTSVFVDCDILRGQFNVIKNKRCTDPLKMEFYYYHNTPIEDAGFSFLENREINIMSIYSYLKTDNNDLILI